MTASFLYPTLSPELAGTTQPLFVMTGGAVNLKDPGCVSRLERAGITYHEAPGGIELEGTPDALWEIIAPSPPRVPDALDRTLDMLLILAGCIMSAMILVVIAL